MDQAAREGGAPVTPETGDGSQAASEQRSLAPDEATTGQTAPKQNSPPASGEQKSPEQLREDIEETREQLGDTVEALASKTDVKAQAKDRIAAVKDEATQKKDEFISKAKAATPESAGAGGKQIASTVQSKPVPFAALGAFAAGLLIGWLIGRR
jgi:ElaB/YqjD/DUF883 family membrane-anchored ribosome-binding protein